MDPLLASLILVLLALAGARVSFSPERTAAGPRLVLRTGVHFLVLGAFLGPAGLGLFSDEAVTGLSPFLALGLGWMGLHFGLQLDRADLRRFPWHHHVFAYGQALLTLVAFVVIAWGLAHLAGYTSPAARLTVFGAAATAAVTAPMAVAMVSSNFMARGPVRDLLFFAASLDALVGIAAMEFIYGLYRPTGVAEVAWQSGLRIVGLAAGLGLICAIVFLWLVRTRPRGEELVLYLLGICALASGAALQWGFSPLFVSAVMGAVVANLGDDVPRVRRILNRWEKPVYMAFLLIAGALVVLPGPALLGLAGLYTLVRGLAKSVAGGGLARALPFGFSTPKRMGLGLIPQGGFSLAMAVSFVLLYPELSVEGIEAAPALLTVVVLAVILSELAGPFLTAQALRRAGEILPGVDEALAEGDTRRAEIEAVRSRLRPAGDSQSGDPEG